MIVKLDNVAIADRMVAKGWDEHKVANKSGVTAATVVRLLNTGAANFNTARGVLVALDLDPKKYMKVPTMEYYARSYISVDAIERIMEENGDTYESVAHRMGMSKQGFWQIAHEKMPRSKTLKKVANALGVSVEEIIKGE